MKKHEALTLKPGEYVVVDGQYAGLSVEIVDSVTPKGAVVKTLRPGKKGLQYNFASLVRRATEEEAIRVQAAGAA